MELSQESPTRVIWAPQPGPQEALIKCPFPLVGFGGARGGGKTDGILGKYAIKGEKYGKDFNAVFFRKTMPQQDDLIERAKEIYLEMGADWGEQKKMFRLRGGGRIRFRSLENDQDAQSYQGQNITDAAIEEAGNYGDPSPIWKLFGALRSKTGVPVQLLLSFNPGGPGHSWLKKMFIDPAPSGSIALERTLSNGKAFRYVFIRSLVEDNKILLANDPGYLDRLHLVGSPELVRAWVEGDFEIHEGSFFPEFAGRHIVDPFPIPKHWPKYVGFDWGYHSPFCAVWGAVSSGKTDGGVEVPYPKGSVVIYREYSGTKLSNNEIGSRIAELSEDENPIYIADPSIFHEKGGRTIADDYVDVGVHFRPADNDRISGWNEIRRRLYPKPAMLYFFRSCPYIRESLPALPIDPKRGDDADTTADDHGPDALRYLLKGRPLEKEYTEPVKQDRMGSIRIATYVERKRLERTRPRI